MTAPKESEGTRTTEHKNDILGHLCDVARPVMLKYMRADSCIASTLVGIQVLEKFRIPSFSLALKVAAFNRQAVEYLRDGHPDWVKSRKNGAWGVGAGYGEFSPTPRRPDGFDGHVVIIAMVGDKEYLVDLSIDQVSRPAKGIVFGPFYCDYAGFKDRKQIVVPNDDKAILIYEQDPPGGLLEYTDAPDWSVSRWQTVIDEVVVEMRKRLSE